MYKRITKNSPTVEAPSIIGTFRQEHKNSPISSSYRSDLNYLFEEPIVAWTFGHTHHSCDLQINNIRLLSNQRGLQNENTNFHELFTFEI